MNPFIPRRAVLLLVTLLAAASPARAQADANQALINLLVKKGILSAEDVNDLRREITAQPSSTAAPTGVPVTATPPTTPATTPVYAAAIAKRDEVSALSFRIGSADFTPFGFMDFMGVYRNTNVGSGISTNFAGIPYRNSTAGQLSETRFSAQNSRLGLRVDSSVGDAKVLGYVETDFLGNAASTLNVTSNSATLRMRLYFADLAWKHWELLAGQAWSLLTPNRVGLSAIPSDLFYTMDLDIAYQAGLTWARQPQVRVVYRPSEYLTAGLSAENPDQYVGGANGSAAVTLPAGFNASEVDTGAASTAPNRAPDLIAKVALDTRFNGLPWHAEVAGLYRTFEVNTYTAGAAPVNSDDAVSGYGGSFNVDLEVVKNLNLLGTAFVSEGGGRYIYGQAPDFVVNPANSSGAYTLSTLSARSYLGGLEWKAAPATVLYGYFSAVEIGQRYSRLPSGAYAGYGYPGSPNSQNKEIKEYTLGASQTLWKDRNHGSLLLNGQASYVERLPWYVAGGAPGKADATMVFVDLRYVFP